MKHKCGGCVESWSGANIAHCGACHHTFSSVGWFDLHRQGMRCADPANLRVEKTGEPRLRLNDHGVWVGNQERPKFWEKAA